MATAKKPTPAPKVAQPAPVVPPVEAPAPAPVEPPVEAPAPAPVAVTFWSHYKALQVWSPAGFVGAFEDGELTTDDPAKIEVLRSLAEVGGERKARKE